MFLPPLFERDVDVLIEEHKRLNFARSEIDDVARGLKASPQFAEALGLLDYGISELRAEILRRAQS